MNMHRWEIIRRVGQDKGKMVKDMVDCEVPNVCVQYIGNILFLNTFFLFYTQIMNSPVCWPCIELSTGPKTTSTPKEPCNPVNG